MKHVRDNIYEHDGVMVEAVSAGDTRCKINCPFYTECRNRGGLIGFSCTGIIGGRVFKLYKEPKKVEKIKLADVSFKCAVLTPERSEILQKAVFAAGGAWKDSSVGQNVFVTKYAFLMITNGVMSHQQNDFRFFANSPLPETTLQQALVILSAVEKPEPVFDIKLRDEVLCRDAAEAWEIKNFARTRGDCSNFATFGARYLKMIRFAGNEQYHGSKDAPSGWWEARDGKPVWVTR